MKIAIQLAFLLICSISVAQTSLLDTSTWMVGNGSVLGFTKNGTDAQNVRELGVNPHGDSVVVWKGIADPATTPDGGWYTGYYSIDPSKTYRLSVWIKKTNSASGKTYFGLQTRDGSAALSTLNLNGTSNTNPYLWSGDLPVLDKWYLLVGFIHPSGYTGTTVIGGVYDGVSGVKVLDALDDFKFSAGSVEILHRAYFNYGTDTSDRQFFWEPTIYEINGNEPTIAELISPSVSGSAVWNTTGTDINYTAGSVGIGTATVPSGYTFAVDGKAIVEEVKVQLSGNWADYVFTKEYQLPTLKEVEQHINDNGHLINIPSAEEVEANGIELGEMNRLLLEKIEELTLYILEQEKRISDLEHLK